MKPDCPDKYDSYVVRLWREARHATCYASATSVRNGKTVHFATLEALYAFLGARATSLGEGRQHEIDTDG